MKKKIFIKLFAGVVLLVLCVSLTGCKKKNNYNEVKNETNVQNEVNNVATNQTTNETKPKKIKVVNSAPDFYKLPENVEMHIVVSDIDVGEQYYHVTKIGKDVLITEESRKNDIVISKGIGKYYSYYKYNGNDAWDYYYTQDNKEWRLYKGNIDLKTIDEYVVRVPQLFTKLTGVNSGENEKTSIFLPAYGDVDITIVSDGNKKYYYADELKFNVKFESADVTINIEKFDTEVSDFGIQLPK